MLFSTFAPQEWPEGALEALGRPGWSPCGHCESQTLLFWRGKSPCGHCVSQTLFLKHRDSLEGLFCDAGIAQWGGPWAQNLEVPGSIPGSCRSLLGHFFVMLGSLVRYFWEVLGSVWEYCGGGLGWVWEGLEKKFRGGRKIEIFKSVREYFSCVGRCKTIIFSLFPDRKPRKIDKNQNFQKCLGVFVLRRAVQNNLF